ERVLDTLIATHKGTVKKTELKDFSNVMSRGIIAIGIDKDDELVSTTLTDGNQIVFLASHDGQAIRFDENDVRSMGRPAYGVRGMNLDKGDYIVGMATTPKDAKRAEADAQTAKAKAGVPEATATDETIPVKGSLILSVTEMVSTVAVASCTPAFALAFWASASALLA